MIVQKMDIKKILFDPSGKASLVVEWAVAMAFFQGIIGNVVSFYLTLGTQIPAIRWGVNWSVNAILFLIIVSCFAVYKGRWKSKFVVMFWPLFVVGIYFAAILVYPAYVTKTIKECLVLILQGGTLAMGAWLIYTRVVVLERVLVKTIVVGAFLQPVFIGLITTFLRRVSTDTDNFGTITYLEIAYSALTLLAIIFYYYGWGNSGTQKGKKIIFGIAVLEVLISSVVIGISGSRGALVGVGFLLICLVIMSGFFKGKRKLWILILFSGASIIMAYVGLPETSVSKMRVENQYTHYGDTITPEQEAAYEADKNSHDEKMLFTMENGQELVVKDLANGITKDWCDKIGINQQLLSIFYENSWEGGGMGALAEEMRDQLERGYPYNKELGEAVYSVTNGSASRLYLWMEAVYELEMNQGRGMAPFGYHLKYNNYAHNIWIEAYAEFGIIGGTVFLFVTLLVLACAIWEARKNKENIYFLVFLAMSFTQLFFSGNIYGDRWLCFLMATGAISMYTWKKKGFCKKVEVLS